MKINFWTACFWKSLLFSLHKNIKNKIMSTTIYSVEIPPIHYLLLGLETKSFSNENKAVAKEQALCYLSEVLRRAVEKEVMEIWDFENDQSSELEKITNLNHSIYTEENGNLNFERILQCKIEYTFNKYIRKNAVFNQHIHGSATEKLNSYGFFALTASQSDKHGKSVVFKIKNEERGVIRNKFIAKGKSPLNYFDKLKIQEVKELYFDKENNYQKAILNSDSYLEFEKIFLSIQNTFFITKYLFIPENYRKYSTEILDLLVQTYSTENKFEFYTDLEIEGIHFYVYTHENISCSLTYSKTGKLYIREFNGVIEAHEHTTFSDIIEIKTDDQDLENIIKII